MYHLATEERTACSKCNLKAKKKTVKLSIYLTRTPHHEHMEGESLAPYIGTS
jgi:hypothetical protein